MSLNSHLNCFTLLQPPEMTSISIQCCGSSASCLRSGSNVTYHQRHTYTMAWKGTRNSWSTPLSWQERPRRSLRCLEAPFHWPKVLMRMHFGKDLLDDAQTLKLQYGRCCIDYRHDHMTWTWCMRVSHIFKKQKIKTED